MRHKILGWIQQSYRGERGSPPPKDPLKNISIFSGADKTKVFTSLEGSRKLEYKQLFLQAYSGFDRSDCTSIAQGGWGQHQVRTGIFILANQLSTRGSLAK